MSDTQLAILIQAMVGELGAKVRQMEQALPTETHTDMMGREYQIHRQTEDLWLVLDAWLKRADALLDRAGG